MAVRRLGSRGSKYGGKEGMTKSSAAEEVDGRGSGSGESGKTVDGEGDWWQGSKWLLACSAWPGVGE